MTQEHKLSTAEKRIKQPCNHSIRAHDDSGFRRLSEVHAVVIHCTGADNQASSTAAFFHSAPGAGSTQLIVDDHSCYRTLPDDTIPWGAPPLNQNGLHIEIEGPVDWSPKTWKAHEGRLDRAAFKTARWCKTYNIPLRFVWKAGGLPSSPSAFRGITCHAAISNKWHESCVTADTPILCRDLIWRPAGDLLPGDELIALDEAPPNQEGRRFRNAVVTENSVTRDALLLVNTARGSVRCNYQHPWLVRAGLRNKWGAWQWKRTDELQPGDEVMHLFDPWVVDRSWEAGWLAGMYDGEGWFAQNSYGKDKPRSGVTLGVCQRESDTLDRLAAAVKERADCSYIKRLPTGAERRQPLGQVVISQRQEVMRMLGSIRPPRLLDKAWDFWVGGSVGRTCTRVAVESIEPAGTGLISNLSTDTKTYIAGGFAMHNTHQDPGAGFPYKDFEQRVRRFHKEL